MGSNPILITIEIVDLGPIYLQNSHFETLLFTTNLPFWQLKQLQFWTRFELPYEKMTSSSVVFIKKP